MKRIVLLIAISVVGTLIAGCGKQVATPPVTKQHVTQSPSTNRVLLQGAAGYSGVANLKKWAQTANENPHSYIDQIQAGIAEFVNGHPHSAIRYYESAAAISPQQGESYTDIGNVYRQTLRNNAKAIQYYRESTARDPSYGFGWYDLAYVYSYLENNKSAATNVYHQALKALPSGDPYLKDIQQLISGMK